MASAQLVANELVAKDLLNGSVDAKAKDFEYVSGMWEKPTKDDEPAKLTYGDKIKATCLVDTYSLGRKQAKIFFKFGKPKEEEERCFGWEKSNLWVTAIMGSKSTSGGLGYLFQDLEPGKQITVTPYLLDMEDNDDPVHKKLQLIVSDDDPTPKAGLHFYEAWAVKQD